LRPQLRPDAFQHRCGVVLPPLVGLEILDGGELLAHHRNGGLLFEQPRDRLHPLALLARELLELKPHASPDRSRQRGSNAERSADGSAAGPIVALRTAPESVARAGEIE
jgi:hypothetical protein